MTNSNDKSGELLGQERRRWRPEQKLSKAAFFKVVVASPSNYAALFSACSSRSGFSSTVPIGSQFRVRPDQRS
ncbi:hypothetical protein, partial [Pseudomonas corrugata]|uniref:hypothetical protein n=1 Tax=Pseudomonas corrugata TaxID=47879 RepID=UPI0028C4C492